MNDTERYEGFQKLREKFPESAIGKMPRGNVQLDYVGHANVTARLLDVDPEWTWEPLATDEYGLPVFDRAQNGAPVGLWIRLTVLGHTRLGYGSVQPGAFDSVKQLIGDAIRNAAMRFGVALDLWSKEELVSDSAGSANPSSASQRKAPAEPQDASREASSPPKDSGEVTDAGSHPPFQADAVPVASPDQSQESGDASPESSRVWGSARGGEGSVPPAAESWEFIEKAVEDKLTTKVKVQMAAVEMCMAIEGTPIPAKFSDVAQCPPEILARLAERIREKVPA